MPAKSRILLVLLVALALATLAAVCLHSLEEIHYLKSFFPPTFTVQEAFYAAALELIKIVVIALPLVLVVAVCLFFWRYRHGPLKPLPPAPLRQ
jgi:lipopolysaccharide export LptBFGC system permease protein LptF